MPSDLERVVLELRAHMPPPPRASLRPAILSAFDGASFGDGLVARRAAASRARVLRRLAAAAVLASIAGVWGARSGFAPRVSVAPAPNAPAIAPESADALFRRALLEARVAAARETLATRSLWTPESARPTPSPAEGTDSAAALARSALVAPRDPAEPVREVAALIDQPVGSLLRLASARMLERVDRDLAAVRYREILQDFPLGAASAVARSRLRSLPP